MDWDGHETEVTRFYKSPSLKFVFVSFTCASRSLGYGAIESLYVCVHLITLNKSDFFHEIRYECFAIENRQLLYLVI
jgi:hypothetical protein